MALIKCRECGKEISDQAEVCPNCGAKTRTGEIARENKMESTQLDRKGIVIGICGIGGIIAFFWALFTMMNDKSNCGNIWGPVGYNYKGHLTDHEKTVLIWLFIGLGLMISAIIEAYNLQKEKEALKELYNHRLKKAEKERAQEESWKCNDCGKENLIFYNTCQQCGAARPKDVSIKVKTQAVSSKNIF